jgi:hypothetical protein
VPLSCHRRPDSDSRSHAGGGTPAGRDARIHAGLRGFAGIAADRPARSVTPEVAGSSPVAPAKIACKSASFVVSVGASDRRLSACPALIPRVLENELFAGVLSRRSRDAPVPSRARIASSAAIAHFRHPGSTSHGSVRQWDFHGQRGHRGCRGKRSVDNSNLFETCSPCRSPGTEGSPGSGISLIASLVRRQLCLAVLVWRLVLSLDPPCWDGLLSGGERRMTS